MNKKIITPFALLILICVVYVSTSCKKADIKFGEEFLDNDITQIYKTDSFGVDLSTVYLDSFITSAKGTVLLGGYTDPQFGTITTQSYFELIPPTYADVYANTIFDSINLILKPAFGSFYGDSTMPINVNVHELADSIYLPENIFNFYNTSKFNVKPTALISNKSIVIRPNADKEISIRLQDVFGSDFLNKLKTPADNTLKTAAAFLNYFKGMRLSASGGSQMVIGFGDDVIMRLYYKKPDLITQEKYIDFTLSNKSHQFNNISIARSGALLTQGFGASNKVISSSLTGNAAYTQAATGSMIKLTFPAIKDVLKLPSFAKVLKASLVIKPVKGSYSTTFYVPPTLRLSTTNANNTIGNDLAYITNNGALAIQLGLLQTDYFLGEKTQYQYDLTEYVKSLLRTSNITPGEGLLLTPPSPNFENEFARVIVGDKANTTSKIQLVIYYAAVK